jgi:hypothetical protein
VTRPRWTTLTIRLGSQDTPLEGNVRLVALLRWLRSEAPPDVVVSNAAGSPIAHPREVDWANFPLDEATLAAQAIKQRP